MIRKNSEELKQQLKECGDKQENRTSNIDEQIKKLDNIPSKQDIKDSLKEETKNLATKDDVKNEINKIPKVDTKPLEKKIDQLPTKESLGLMADSISEEIGQEHEKTRNEIKKQQETLDHNKEAIDKISTEQLQNQLEETLKQLEDSRSRQKF